MKNWCYASSFSKEEGSYIYVAKALTITEQDDHEISEMISSFVTKFVDIWLQFLKQGNPSTALELAGLLTYTSLKKWL